MPVTVTLFVGREPRTGIQNLCRHKEGDGFFIKFPDDCGGQRSWTEGGKAIFRTARRVCITGAALAESRLGSEEKSCDQG